MWIPVLWLVIGLIFLVQTAAVQTLLDRVRHLPMEGAFIVAFSLVYLGSFAFDKSGTNLNGFAFSPASIASSPIISTAPFQATSQPAWWTDDPTDTDGDGMPDKWEKWTHSDPFVADAHLDRDGDGLTDLEEFWNQTDPRTADTDGDGFDDGFEVAHGMNPLVPEDFTVFEPDANNNGIIDRWEQAPYLYGFDDGNDDGFDDRYAQYILEPESDDNFDVWVHVYSSRSAALAWTTTNNTLGLVLMATTGTVVRLRLPFGEDTGLCLLPSPEGVDPPPGELWKSRMTVRFAPRPGQSVTGNALVSANSTLAHQVVGRESAVVRFDSSPPNGMQIMTAGQADSVGPATDIKAGHFDVHTTSRHHGVGDGVGPFVVTNMLGLQSAVFSWSSAYGTLTPETGLEAWLTIQRLPESPTDKISVVTTAELDALTRIAITNLVDPCPRNTFDVTLSTNNFSPHLFETNWISVTLPGCACQNDPGWLEIEVMREIIGATQHVASVDMDPAASGVDRFVDVTGLSPGIHAFAWDGIAQVSLPLADHPDVFNGPRGSFNRAMPEIHDGEPLPPPFHTLVVRFWDVGKNNILNYEETRVYIPQIVNFVPFGGKSVFQEPIYSYGTNGTEQIELYTGCTEAEAEDAFALLSGMTLAFYPSDANLRIVMTEQITGRHLSLLIVGASSHEMRRGDASAFSPRNERPYGEMAVYLRGFQASLQNNYDRMLAGNNDSIPVPMTPVLFARYMAPTIAHELGHGVGLVDPSWLEAIESGRQRRHNAIQSWVKMMDMGELYYVGHRLAPHPTNYWLPDNLRYLRFVLPKGE